MTGETRKRPWLAALLALVYPGLGHVYLRSWLRALLWFGMVVLTVVLFVPEAAMASVTSLAELEAAISMIPIEATIALVTVTAFNIFDAYWLARQENVRAEGLHCPYCGRPVDEELTFCHWCTSEFTIEETSA